MSNSESLDILWGVKAISAFIGRTERSTFHLLERGHIPAARKVGGKWCVRRSALAEWFAA